MGGLGRGGASLEFERLTRSERNRSRGSSIRIARKAAQFARPPQAASGGLELASLPEPPAGLLIPEDDDVPAGL